MTVPFLFLLLSKYSPGIAHAVVYNHKYTLVDSQKHQINGFHGINKTDGECWDDERTVNDASALWHLVVIFLVLIHFTGMIRISFIRILIFPLLLYVHSYILAFRLKYLCSSYIPFRLCSFFLPAGRGLLFGSYNAFYHFIWI